MQVDQDENELEEIDGSDIEDDNVQHNQNSDNLILLNYTPCDKPKHKYHSV